ncbi:MAG TPA: glycoside hydrolase family 95 protein, partial [Flavisolibacter sp.]
MKFVFFIFLSVFMLVGQAQKNQPLKLWYKQPSGTTWENALPIGNGRLGAMVYGNVETETVQLNEHTVWSGSPNRNDNPLVRDSLAVLRQLVYDGRQKDAERIANRIIISKGSHGQMFQPVGELKLAFDGHETYTDFYRELDIEKAVAKTSYTVAGVTYTREVLASLPDRVVVIRLTASRPQSLHFTAFYAPLLPGAKRTVDPTRQLLLAGTAMDHEGVKGQVRYKAIAKIKTEGGTVATTDTTVRINGATA